MQVCTLLQHPPLSFLEAGCPSCRPTNSVKALKATCYWNSVRNIHSQLSCHFQTSFSLLGWLSAVFSGIFGDECTAVFIDKPDVLSDCVAKLTVSDNSRQFFLNVDDSMVHRLLRLFWTTHAHVNDSHAAADITDFVDQPKLCCCTLVPKDDMCNL